MAHAKEEIQRLLASAPIKGRYVTLEAFEPATHAASLWTHLSAGAGIAALFRWMPLLIPHDVASLSALLESLPTQYGLAVYAIVGDPEYLNPPAASQQGRQQQEQQQESQKESSPRLHRRETLGVIGYLDIHPSHRALEVGGVIFSPLLQRTCAATEAHYLLLRNVLESPSPTASAQEQHLQYTRIAYKCHALNTASRRAAERLGYVYEGKWRKHMLVEGKPRDSDWLSIIDEDWPVVKKALEEWLEDGNFDEQGRQKRSLESIRAALA
jgi:RimJ/RimL family protein N-acetyltransferase